MSQMLWTQDDEEYLMIAVSDHDPSQTWANVVEALGEYTGKLRHVLAVEQKYKRMFAEQLNAEPADQTLYTASRCYNYPTRGPAYARKLIEGSRYFQL